MTTVQQLADAQVHIGHRTGKWNPKMRPYIAGKADGAHVLDLQQTSTALAAAVSFLQACKKEHKQVLFVGTKPQASFVLQQLAVGNDKLLYVDEKWSPGLITNFNELRTRIDQYLRLKDQFATDEILKYTKKEVAVFRKELEKLDRVYHGVAGIRKKADALVVLDAVGNRNAIDEAVQSGVPVIALVDSNADPDGVTYPIPANDDSIPALTFVTKTLIDALA
ncbi:30S ribosomal protein S2 [Candidatus Peribacteria bacterium]|nr:30S ribosomal protein S2 [Candidatus Peribacteria bacterium]